MVEAGANQLPETRRDRSDRLRYERPVGELIKPNKTSSPTAASSRYPGRRRCFDAARRNFLEAGMRAGIGRSAQAVQPHQRRERDAQPIVIKAGRGPEDSAALRRGRFRPPGPHGKALATPTRASQEADARPDPQRGQAGRWPQTLDEVRRSTAGPVGVLPNPKRVHGSGLFQRGHPGALLRHPRDPQRWPRRWTTSTDGREDLSHHYNFPPLFPSGENPADALPPAARRSATRPRRAGPDSRASRGGAPPKGGGLPT